MENINFCTIVDSRLIIRTASVAWQGRKSIYACVFQIFITKKEERGKKNSCKIIHFVICKKPENPLKTLLIFYTHTPPPWFNIMCCSTRYRWWSWQTLSIKLTTRLIFARAGKSAAARSIWTFVFARFVSGANIYGRRCKAYELVKSAALMISVAAWYWLTDRLCTRSLKVGVRSGGGKVSEVSQKKGKRGESAVNKKKIKEVDRAQVGVLKKNISRCSFRTKISRDQTKLFIHP